MLLKIKLFVLKCFIKSTFLPGIDPNGTAARNALPGTVPGSTPGVLLASVRGYYKVVEVFKRYYSSNFLLENKFQQTILHVVLKAGYYNKIVVHGDDSGFVNIKTIHALFRKEVLIYTTKLKYAQIFNIRESQKRFSIFTDSCQI